MFQYFPFEQEVDVPYVGRCQTVGLRVLYCRNNVEEEVMAVPDISTDFAFVLRLARLFTQQQLEPIHLLDVIEDML